MRGMALEKSGKLEATNLFLYIAMLHIDETPVKVGNKNKSGNI